MELADRGLLEWCVVDPGSVNLLHENDITKGSDGFIYSNPTDHIRAGLILCDQCQAHPSYAIYEPGFVRSGAALACERSSVPRPVYRFMFSDGFMFGFPPKEYALSALVSLLDETAPRADWMVSGLAVDIFDLIPLALEKGGHVRVGLEDAPFGSEKTNVQLVEDTRSIIERQGFELADAAEIRRSQAIERR